MNNDSNLRQTIFLLFLLLEILQTARALGWKIIPNSCSKKRLLWEGSMIMLNIIIISLNNYVLAPK